MSPKANVEIHACEFPFHNKLEQKTINPACNLLNPKMTENCVLVWLGGSAMHLPSPATEFNMMQDIAGARVVFGCGIPRVQLPCCGIVDHFTTSKYELEHWLKGKNALCDYLCENTVNEAESYAKGKPWTRVIWDVTAVAWLVNDNNRFMANTNDSLTDTRINKRLRYESR